MKKIMPLVILLTLVGCGDDHGGRRSSGLKAQDPAVDPVVGDPIEFERLEVEREADVMETYLASFTPLNEKIAGKVSGSLTIHKEGDFLAAHVRVLGAAPKIIHAQNIHFGQVCPTEAADLNQDGVVDIMEAHQFTGNTFIPLDGDINSQYSLLGSYPVADDWGAYVYSQIGSYTLFMQDLAAADEVPDDFIVKPAVAGFNLQGKVVIIQGVAEDITLPESAESTTDLTANQTLPIACGVLDRVWTVPGSVEEDDVTVGSTRVPSPGREGGSPGRPTTRPNRNERTSPLGVRKPCVREDSSKRCKRT